MDEYEKVGEPRDGLFRVGRTSTHGDTEIAPCEGAKLKRVRMVDARTVDDPKKIPANRGTDGDWYQHGENHRVEDGCIVRDVGWRVDWFIEIVDVLQFVRDHGQCIVQIGSDGYPYIEIYDDWRE